MKILQILLLCTIGIADSYAQNLSIGSANQPDGITIVHSNLNDKPCDALIFIGDSLQVLFPCLERLEKNNVIDDYTEVDISDAISIVDELRSIITFEFIKELHDCDLNGRDTADAYEITIKHGKRIERFLFGLENPEIVTCGKKRLHRAMKLYNKILRKYK